MMRFWLTLSLLLIAYNSWAELFKWVDAKGNTHYSDKPPASSKNLETLEQLSTINSYTPAQVEYNNPSEATANEVIMYSTSWCGYCKKARRYFQANNIAFREYDIEASSSAYRRFKELGGNGVPLILVGTKSMSGFNQKRFDSLYNSN